MAKRGVFEVLSMQFNRKDKSLFHLVPCIFILCYDCFSVIILIRLSKSFPQVGTVKATDDQKLLWYTIENSSCLVIINNGPNDSSDN